MAKGDYLNKCDVCGKPADGPMLSPMFAHSDCVIAELNKFLDSDYDGKGEPATIVGYVAQARADALRAVIEELSKLPPSLKQAECLYWLKKPSNLGRS